MLCVCVCFPLVGVETLIPWRHPPRSLPTQPLTGCDHAPPRATLSVRGHRGAGPQKATDRRTGRDRLFIRGRSRKGRRRKRKRAREREKKDESAQATILSLWWKNVNHTRGLLILDMECHMPYDKTSMWIYIYMGMRELQLFYLSIERLNSCLAYHMPTSTMNVEK